MKALLFERKELKFAAAMAAGRFLPGAGARVGPLKLTEIDEPELPGEGWVRLRPRLSGICGSDLSTIDGHTSRYFDPLVSFPFVPGHEIVADTEDGRRVIVEPVLGPVPRGEEPPWPGAAQADGFDYGHLVTGPLEPGLQIGSCADTGGGWSESLVAHESQLHLAPTTMSDEAAVVVEPTAAGIHAALRTGAGPQSTVVVIGAGMMGLAAVAGLRHVCGVERIVVAARYPHQRMLARMAGADEVVGPEEIVRAVRRFTGARVIGDSVSAGVDACVDAVGSSATITDAINLTRPRGRVVMLGMPARVSLDLAPLWHRETELVGAYCYGTEHVHDRDVHTFDLALDLVHQLDLGRLTTATYPLDRYEAAIEHAAQAGIRGAVRISFDLRS